jgi:hypothetical protein
VAARHARCRRPDRPADCRAWNGTNPRATLTGNILEDEKAVGTPISRSGRAPHSEEPSFDFPHRRDVASADSRARRASADPKASCSTPERARQRRADTGDKEKRRYGLGGQLRKSLEAGGRSSAGAASAERSDRRPGDAPVPPHLIEDQSGLARRGVNSSQVAAPRIGPRTNLHPPSASGGNMYLQRSHLTSGVGAAR